MIQQRIEELRASLREALFLDLDAFGLESGDRGLVSKFIGLSLHSAFQPIWGGERHGETVGYEALLRPQIGPETVSPVFAFEFSDKQGHLVKLDRIARTLHTLNYLSLPDNKGLLFLNVHPKLLASVNAHGKVFERILHSYSVPTNQVVIEVQESAVEIDKQLMEAIGNYRDRNYKIAIDDFGGKRSNLDRLWKISPDFIKLGINIIHEAESNAKVRRVLPKLIEIAHELGAQAIVEGIENKVQYQIAVDAGAPLLQGFHLGCPAPQSAWTHPPLGVAA